MPTPLGEPAAPPETTAPGTATALLNAYRPGTDRFLSSPHRTLLARGTRAEVPYDERPLTRRVRSVLAERRAAGEPEPLVAGSVPFAPDAPAVLAVPESVRWAPALRHDPLIALPPPAPAHTDWRIREEPAAERYTEAVAAAVARMRAGELRKAVLARTLELTSPHRPDLPGLLARLAHRDPAGYTFAVPSGSGRTLVGASPELLVSRSGGQLLANPLAGTAPRSADLAEDVQRAAALLESAKDLDEHALVVDAVREALAPYCTRLDIPERPTLVRTAALWHLSTTATGTLADPSVCALELALALHPTPAVCGTPTGPARQLIADAEPFDRGAYTGVVGWQDAEGDGEWVVAIRCAEAEENTLRLFAGAGVVAGSSPAAETAETTAKFRTMLGAVGAAR
ncbi:isochorismate synthase [Streptomyces sp. NPDC058045]|uniref:isochorismate synthase n=1 Tax=Streptomyces sp. NPDC058045 TaxID=3346311 RepID=UPI0036EC67A8